MFHGGSKERKIVTLGRRSIIVYATMETEAVQERGERTWATAENVLSLDFDSPHTHTFFFAVISGGWGVGKEKGEEESDIDGVGVVGARENNFEILEVGIVEALSVSKGGRRRLHRFP